MTSPKRLRRVCDSEPGLRRERRGGTFAYLDVDGREISDPEILARIRSLAIPPAYTDVWICVHANGHIQATGRDARGRKQYRYHPQWRCQRDESKFGPLAASVTQARRNVTVAVAQVAQRLGNTPAVCRKSYIHPALIEAYGDGSLFDGQRRQADGGTGVEGLSDDEAKLLAFLEEVCL